MPSMIQNDFLNPLFSLNPFLVALIFLVAGWGYLVLAAWRLKTLNALLKHPGYMVGDLIMIPLAGFLITLFYQSVNNPTISVLSVRWIYFGIAFATLYTIITFIASIFISKTVHGFWFIPHTIFIWFISYVLFNFFTKGFLQVLSKTTPSLLSIYIIAALAVLTHFILIAVFGYKTAV